MQTRTTRRYPLTPARLALIKKTSDDKCWQGHREKGSLAHCWWEWKLAKPLWKKVWRFLTTLKIELPYDPAIPLVGTYPKELKSGSQRDTCALVFTATFLTIAKT